MYTMTVKSMQVSGGYTKPDDDDHRNILYAIAPVVKQGCTNSL